MATSYKILGQARPSNTSNVDLYTVPAGTETVISSIFVANSTSTARNFRIFIRNDGATAGQANAIAYDVEMAGNSFTAITTGITLDESDVITVQSAASNALTFSAFGSEII